MVSCSTSPGGRKMRLLCQAFDRAQGRLVKNSKKLGRAFKDVATHPAVWLCAGNTVLAGLVSSDLALVINGLVTTGAISLRAIESWTGRPMGLPFGVLSLATLTSAGLTLHEGVVQYGVGSLTTFAPEARDTLFAALAYTGWGIGHGISALQEWRNKVYNSVFSNRFTYYSIANGGSSQTGSADMNVVSLGLIAASFARAVSEPYIPDFKNRPALANMRYHITPARLTAGCYLGAIVQTGLQDPNFVIAAQTCWFAGVALMDGEQNRAAVRALRDRILPGQPPPATPA